MGLRFGGACRRDLFQHQTRQRKAATVSLDDGEHVIARIKRETVVIGRDGTVEQCIELGKQVAVIHCATAVVLQGHRFRATRNSERPVIANGKIALDGGQIELRLIGFLVVLHNAVGQLGLLGGCGVLRSEVDTGQAGQIAAVIEYVGFGCATHVDRTLASDIAVNVGLDRLQNGRVGARVGAIGIFGNLEAAQIAANTDLASSVFGLCRSRPVVHRRHGDCLAAVTIREREAAAALGQRPATAGAPGAAGTAVGKGEVRYSAIVRCDGDYITIRDRLGERKAGVAVDADIAGGKAGASPVQQYGIGGDAHGGRWCGADTTIIGKAVAGSTAGPATAAVGEDYRRGAIQNMDLITGRCGDPNGQLHLTGDDGGIRIGETLRAGNIIEQRRRQCVGRGFAAIRALDHQSVGDATQGVVAITGCPAGAGQIIGEHHRCTININRNGVVVCQRCRWHSDTHQVRSVTLGQVLISV